MKRFCSLSGRAELLYEVLPDDAKISLEVTVTSLWNRL